MQLSQLCSFIYSLFKLFSRFWLGTVCKRTRVGNDWSESFIFLVRTHFTQTSSCALITSATGAILSSNSFLLFANFLINTPPFFSISRYWLGCSPNFRWHSYVWKATLLEVSSSAITSHFQKNRRFSLLGPSLISILCNLQLSNSSIQVNRIVHRSGGASLYLSCPLDLLEDSPASEWLLWFCMTTQWPKSRHGEG